ncbi:MAG: acyl-CoA thioesterase [Terrimicrobiaceae bacterium]
MSRPSRKTRGREPFFERCPGDPAPLKMRVSRRVLFSDADPMGVLWHGRFPAFFETAAAELHRACGLGYLDFHKAGIRAPIVQLHVDYIAPAHLDDEVTVEAVLHWNEAARIDTEYTIFKAGPQIVARGHTVQLFTSAASGAPLFTPPSFVESSRQAWRGGQFTALQ